MRLLRFLQILEKSIIVVLALCFVPIVVLAFICSPPFISQELQNAYQLFRSQRQSGFLTSLTNTNGTCTLDMFSKYTSYCINRCTLGTDCFVIAAKDNCPTPYLQAYILNDTKYCLPANTAIINNPTTIDFNEATPPLFSIGNPHVYFLIKSTSSCTNYFATLGTLLNNQAESMYISYAPIMKYLIYFSLVPMIIHVLLMLILDEWGKTNIRVANNILVLHVSLVSTVVIALGLGMIVSFNGFAWTINLLGTECLTHYSQSTTTVSLFTNFTSKDRIPNFFFYFLAFLLVLQGLSILGILAINLLIRLYYRMRQKDSSTTGYQLQSF